MLTVFYDGECGLCHRWVKFLVAVDPNGDKFIFAPIGGGHFKSNIAADRITSLPDSIIVTDESGNIYMRSEAVARSLERVGGAYGVIARAISIVPRFFGDFCYDAVARVRKKLFAKPAAVCPFMDAEMQRRFRLGE